MLQQIFEELNRPSHPAEIPHRIELCRQALKLVSKKKQPEIWGMLQDDLASSLAQVPGEIRAENIEQAIHHYQLALEVRTRQSCPNEWASTQNNLGNAYKDRICGNRAKNIEEAIRCYKLALEVRTRQADPEHWAITQYNLAGAYNVRICGDRAGNLEQGIEYAKQSLDVLTRQAFASSWAMIHNTLGETYRVRIHGSRMENLERAIQHFQLALGVYTRLAFPEDWARVQNNLGNAYLARHRGGRGQNIEQAISHYQQALEVRTRKADPSRWAMTQYNLGNAYRSRIRGNRAENIEQAIFHFNQALEVKTSKTFPEDWAQIQNNLGNAYKARMRGEAAENVEQAIRHYQQALDIRKRKNLPADWAETQHNLGNIYLVRYRGTKTENIEQAIHHYQQALKVRTRTAYPEEWAQTLSGLAGAERLLGSESIEQAIHHYQQALEVRTRSTFPEAWAESHNNLAIAYKDRTHGVRAENIEQAIHHYQLALEVYTRAAFPDQCLRSAIALGNLAFEQKYWELACKAYDTAFGAQDILMQASFSRAVKQIELGEVQYLSSWAAYANFAKGDLKRAVEVMEQGRAQLLRESLEHRRQDLEQLRELGFPDLYDEYVQAMEQYRDLQGEKDATENVHHEDWVSQVDSALQQVQSAAAAIREKAGTSHPQYRYFLKALPFDEIQKHALEKALIYLGTASAGGLALIVSGQGVQAIDLPELNQKSLQAQIWRPTDEEIDRINIHLKQGSITEEDIQAVKGGYFSMYALWSRIPFLTKASWEIIDKLFDAWHKTLDETTHWLWDVVMGNLVEVLKGYGDSVTLIPAGHLALLPLQAAWKDDPACPTCRRYALDEMNISFVPSAYALGQASLAANRPAETLLAVDNPDGTLPYSEREVQFALSAFEKAIHLPGQKAVGEAVLEGMQTSHVLHFATHARAGWEEAEQARLKLADGYLTLPEFFDLDLDQARLAVLSACETGVPGLKLIDEMIGLPAGMMQAGVPGVVGSLWSVSDMSTAMLMARFYILWREEGYMPQEALRLAQIWLRDSTLEQKKIYFYSLGKQSGSRAEAARFFFNQLSYAEPASVNFSSPFYWAAFTYTGV